MILRVLDIVGGTSVDGPGLRTSVYFAGCRHACSGCHNPGSWDMNGGVPMTVDEIVGEIDRNDFNVTLSGGDPFYQIDGMVELARRLKQSGRNVWCYTGFLYEEICADDSMSRLLPFLDVLVDGPFVMSLRDISLRFRGSSNQRLIDLSRSTPAAVTLWT